MSRKRKSHDSNAMRIVPGPNEVYRWTDRELLNLTAALQTYGFSETKKIAEIIETKDENAVKYYLENEILKLDCKFYKYRSSQWISQHHPWFHPHPAELRSWPCVRKWRRLMYNELFTPFKHSDHSKVCMEDLFQAFYEEAEESDDPQVFNVKAVYKYLWDCVRGYVPAELPPIDSGIVLLLLGQLKEMQRDLDFDEEINFLKSFKGARRFKPLKIKDEFKEMKKKAERKQNMPGTPNQKNNTESEMDQNAPVSFQPNNATESKREQNAPVSSQPNNIESEREQKASVSSQPNNTIDAVESNCDDDEAIEVAEEMYHYLTKHKRLVQSMNPMNIPLWTLIKEQGYVQNKCELSPRVNFIPKSGVEP